MILLKKLSLRNFGKFIAKDLTFGEITVFRGDNESGKTTIFDALATVLSDMNKRGELNRYESISGVTPQWAQGIDAASVRVGKDEFLNLYAIRASDVEFDLKPGIPWAKQVTAKLFAGGIMPAEVIDVLTRNHVSTHKSQKFMKTITPLEEEVKKLRGDLQDALGRREEILRQEEENVNSRHEIEGLVEQKTILEKDVLRLNDEIRRGEKILGRAESAEKLRIITGVLDYRAKLSQRLAFEKDDTVSLRQLEQELNEARIERQQTLHNWNQRRADLERINNETLMKSSELSHMDPLAGAAEKLTRQIAGFKPAQIATPKWNVVMLVLGIAALIAGVLISIAYLPDMLRLIGVGASVGVGTILITLAIGLGDSVRIDPKSEADMVRRIKDEWIALSGDATIREISTLSGFFAFFSNQIARYKTTQGLKENLDREAERIRVEIESLQGAVTATEGDIRDRQDGLEAWFRRHGVSHEDEYIRARQDYEKIRALLSAQESRARDRGIIDLDAERVECERRLRDQDSETVRSTVFSREELARLRQELSDRQVELSAIAARENFLTEKISKSAGEAIGRLEPITLKIVQLRKDILDKSRLIDALKLDHEAAKTAIDIFKRIESDHQVQLEILSQDIAGVLKAVTPYAAHVKMDALDTRRLNLADAGGKMRPIDALSTGARDTFFLAARLALARKHAQGHRVIVFDEPFATLDETREAKMVSLLHEFHKDSQWQVVLLTKEKRLAQRMKKECKAKVREI